MKYCVSSRQPISVLRKADEIKVEYRDRNKMFDFIEELPDKNQLILVYCRSGNRSKQASEKLAALGYTNIYEFGGINDWTGELEYE